MAKLTTLTSDQYQNLRWDFIPALMIKGRNEDFIPALMIKGRNEEFIPALMIKGRNEEMGLYPSPNDQGAE